MKPNLQIMPPISTSHTEQSTAQPLKTSTWISHNLAFEALCIILNLDVEYIILL